MTVLYYIIIINIAVNADRAVLGKCTIFKNNDLSVRRCSYYCDRRRSRILDYIMWNIIVILLSVVYTATFGKFRRENNIPVYIEKIAIIRQVKVYS